MRRLLFSVALAFATMPWASADDFIGAFATHTVIDGDEVRDLIQFELGAPLGSLTGTEFTPVFRSRIEAQPNLAAALQALAEATGATGYSILLSRFEHEVVPVNLLSGRSGYAVRLYLTFVVEFFADRAAFSTENRLESVHVVPVVSAQLFPGDRLLSAPPTDDQIVTMYRDALSASIGNLTVSVERDTGLQRRRASRVFETGPIRIDEAAREYLGHIVGDRPDSQEWQLFEQELGYLLHASIMQEIDRRGASDLAVIPPRTNWSTAIITSEIEDRIGLRGELSIAENDRRALIVRAWISRAATLNGEGNSLGRQMFAASEIAGGVYSLADGSLRPASVPEEQRLTSARGAGGFISLVGVADPPIRGMWREGYLDALSEFVPAIVDRMIASSQEIQ